jgi:hypothetical protein
MTLKERAILFAPMALILTLTCVSTYAFVPSKMFLNDAILTDNTIYLTDKENNRWRLSADCNFELNPSDKPEVMIHSRSVREGARVTIRTKNDYKSCRIDSLVKL